MTKQFDNLFSEINAIRSAWDCDFLDALAFIQNNFVEYVDTPVEKEFQDFMELGRRMFEPTIL